jgi:hypothetical protein
LRLSVPYNDVHGSALGKLLGRSETDLQSTAQMRNTLGTSGKTSGRKKNDHEK